MNKYLKVSLTLATIASGSALLIGLMNLATVGAIAANKENKIKNGISRFYPEQYYYTYFEMKENSDELEDGKLLYPTINSVYIVDVPREEGYKRGYVYSTSAKNSYGQVDLLISIKEAKIDEIYVVKNTESYGQTLEDNYINKYNNGYLTDLADVKCGATYGAKIVKEQCDDAMRHYTNNYVKEGE